MRELVGALQRRRERRAAAAAELRTTLAQLSAGVERHLARIAELRSAVEAQGGDVSALRHYDSAMARLRAELRAAERSLAAAFEAAAQGSRGSG
jgi:small-conductance mechanosensitive channel